MKRVADPSKVRLYFQEVLNSLQEELQAVTQAHDLTLEFLILERPWRLSFTWRRVDGQRIAENIPDFIHKELVKLTNVFDNIFVYYLVGHSGRSIMIKMDLRIRDLKPFIIPEEKEEDPFLTSALP